MALLEVGARNGPVKAGNNSQWFSQLGLRNPLLFIEGEENTPKGLFVYVAYSD